MGFKIFFQAIPPKAPGYDGEDDLKPGSSSPKGSSTRANQNKIPSNTRNELLIDDEGRQKTTSKSGFKCKYNKKNHISRE